MAILTEFLVVCREMRRRLEDLRDSTKSWFPIDQRMRPHRHGNEALSAQGRALGTDVASQSTLRLTF